jgi:hypothetical protein
MVERIENDAADAAEVKGLAGQTSTPAVASGGVAGTLKSSVKVSSTEKSSRQTLEPSGTGAGVGSQGTRSDVKHQTPAGQIARKPLASIENKMPVNKEAQNKGSRASATSSSASVSASASAVASASASSTTAIDSIGSRDVAEASSRAQGASNESIVTGHLSLYLESDFSSACSCLPPIVSVRSGVGIPGASSNFKYSEDRLAPLCASRKGTGDGIGRKRGN